MASISVASSGSTPLMREPPDGNCSRPDTHGITPAHAGTTRAVYLTVLTAWDHPRSCGNHIRFQKCLPTFQGSPPLMREPLKWQRESNDVFRITPAHAGTTKFAHIPAHNTWDHPRSCGNHFLSEKIVLPILGSPPLMREPQKRRKNTGCSHRITPAHAGTTINCNG